MNCFIYSIKEKSTNELIYVGSSTNLKNRLYAHKSACYNKNSKQKDFALYQYISNIAKTRKEFDSFFELNKICMFEIESIYDSKRKEYEQYYISLLKPKCNMIKACRTYEDELESSRKSHQRRRENNREQYNEYSRNHRKENLEAYRNWEKEYRASNLQKMRDKGNKWYAAHREEYLAKRKAKRDAQKLSVTKI